MARTEEINGFSISLEAKNGLFFIKIVPGRLFLRGQRNLESSYIENDSQRSRDRVQELKEYARCNQA